MTSAPYHHGNLRAALLEAAEASLREHGVEGVSLRELARETGVSKSAPNRHFHDRQALLNALAIRGFERLDAALGDAVGQANTSQNQLRAAARAFVEFAVRDAALVELMFSLAKTGQRGDVAAAADRVFATIGDLVARGQADGVLRAGDPVRLNLLMAAMFQGVATLISSGRLPAAEADRLIDDAISLFVSSSG